MLVRSEPTSSARVVVLIHKPSKRDLRTGEVLSGQNGRKLIEILRRCEIDPTVVYVTFASPALAVELNGLPSLDLVLAIGALAVLAVDRTGLDTFVMIATEAKTIRRVLPKVARLLAEVDERHEFARPTTIDTFFKTPCEEEIARPVSKQYGDS